MNVTGLLNDKEAFDYSLNDLPSLIHSLGPLIDQAGIVTLKGQLGAGKTTLVKELIASYGVTEDVTSPTFNYVNVYKADDGKTIYHFDLYRLGSLDEFQSMGFDDYLVAHDSICIIEWPEVIESILPKKTLHLNIDHKNPSTRSITFNK